MSVCVYYSLNQLFSQHGWVAHRNENCNVCMSILFHGSRISPNLEGVAHRNENCNVCMCIIFPWSPISPTWRGLLTGMRIAMSVCVYYSFDHLFPQHGGGCWEKWELQCLYVYIIPLITYFPNMEGVAHKNENCNVCICILFPRSPLSQTWRGCPMKRELQCLYVYIIPFNTNFPNMEGVVHINENCNVCMCILIPWSPIFPAWRGLLRELRIAMSVCVYYSLDHLFSRLDGVAHRN